MFYVNSKNGSKYGVIDTNDNVTEYYTVKELVDVIKVYGVKINGVTISGSKVSVKVIDLEKIKKNLSTISDLLISTKNLEVFKQKEYSIGGTDFYLESPPIIDLFICDMGYDSSGFIFLSYNAKLDKYYFYEGTSRDILLKEDYKKQMTELGLMDLRFDIYMTYEEMINYIKSLKDGSKRAKILTNAELSSLYKVVDRPKSWHFPNAIEQFEKAKELAKDGYILVVNGKEMNIFEFESKTKKELMTNGMTVCEKFYKTVSEYIDTENKVYYVGLGEIGVENLM